jgi:ketosteroid isomerase-like protein
MKGNLMSEQENSRLVHQAYQTIKAGNLEAFLDLLSEDVQWQLPEMDNVPFAGKWQSREQVREFFNITDRVQDMVKFAPLEFIAQGDQVVVLGHFVMRIKSTGKDVAADWAHVWTVKNCQIVLFREYVDTALVSRAHTAAQASYRT